jgi:hypothetical protein
MTLMRPFLSTDIMLERLRDVDGLLFRKLDWIRQGIFGAAQAIELLTEEHIFDSLKSKFLHSYGEYLVA